jgi:hypothetical protein
LKRDATKAGETTSRERDPINRPMVSDAQTIQHGDGGGDQPQGLPVERDG